MEIKIVLKVKDVVLELTPEEAGELLRQVGMQFAAMIPPYAPYASYVLTETPWYSGGAHV